MSAQTADEAAVNSRVNGYVEALRAGDAEAYQGFYHEDTVLALWANVTIGRANISVPDGGLPVTFTRHATTVFSPAISGFAN